MPKIKDLPKIEWPRDKLEKKGAQALHKEELLAIAQVAKILNVHPTTLRRWDKKGKLKAIRVGTRRGVGEQRYHRLASLPPLASLAFGG